MKKQLNSAGFGAVEALLVVVIVGLIGVIGWLVWQRQDSKDLKATDLTTSQKDATEQGTSAQVAPVANANDIKITALGVAVTVPDSIKDLTIGAATTGYVKGNAVTNVTFSTTSLKKVLPDCGDAAFSYSLNKGNGTFSSSSASIKLVKQFSGFYISKSYFNGPCYDTDTTPQSAQDLQLSQSNAFETALSTITEIN